METEITLFLVFNLFIMSMTLSLLLTGQNVLTPAWYWVLKLWFSVSLYISFNAATTAFEKGFTEHLGAAIINLALVGFLCNFKGPIYIWKFSGYLIDIKIKFSF